MWYRYYEANANKKLLTYALYVIIVCWFFATAILGYQFLIKHSHTTTKK